MSGPFRDDAVWRAERAAELEADRADLARALKEADARIKAGRRAHDAPLFAKLRSVLGVSFIVIALGGGYVIGRYTVAVSHGCR